MERCLISYSLYGEMFDKLHCMERCLISYSLYGEMFDKLLIVAYITSRSFAHTVSSLLNF